MARDENCPNCDLPGTPVPGDGDLLICRNCGEYFEPEDDFDSNWDQSSHHKTKLRASDD